MKKILVSCLFLFALMALGTQYAVAQRTLTGKVVDKKNVAIAGASIVIKGSTNGTISDKNGNFSLPINNAGTISVNYGNEAQDVNVSATDNNITVKFKATLKDLQKKLEKAKGKKKKK